VRAIKADGGGTLRAMQAHSTASIARINSPAPSSTNTLQRVAGFNSGDMASVKSHAKTASERATASTGVAINTARSQLRGRDAMRAPYHHTPARDASSIFFTGLNSSFE
jgi:hypothetical protein